MGRRHTDAETPVRRGADGQLYMAVQDVTAMLRDMARAFELQAQSGEFAWAAEGGQANRDRLDVGTMRTVAGILCAQADEMDVQLITIAGQRPYG
ncbi:hypothetical protein ACFXPI_35235 [Streptomyces sp. NPDC059104]|uniref:hypothetical protein n=1 Tax=Streptomyces sp. NPDC059104 TaxID=3346729 RepID=UPI0036B6064A